MYPNLHSTDPEVFHAVSGEYTRQCDKIELIASENFTSLSVMEAQGSILTNKYAEGYPGKRYYGGCEWVDVAENIAIERLKTLFGAEYANVQPHSGSGANMAVYFTYLKPGDTVLGMDLAHGGHLTHGSPVNFSGMFYNFIGYGLDEKTGLIDYNVVEDLAKQHRPKMITVGASAYSREIDFSKFRQIADSVGAFLLADIAHPAGLIAKGRLMSPVPYCDIVTSTTHKTLRGPRGGLILSEEKHSPLLDKGLFPGIQGGPLMHIIAAKAVCFGEALQPEFRHYQQQVVRNAAVLAGELASEGFDLISGGTDNHLILIDLSARGVSGLDAERALGAAGLIVNKNVVPSDPRGPRVTSGLRIGTPAVTTRGMKEEEMKLIAALIRKVLDYAGQDSVHRQVRQEVSDLCRRFPIYRYLDQNVEGQA